MEGLLIVLGWMLAGGLIAWWGIWPFVGRSLAGVGCLTVAPAMSWLVVAAAGLAGPAVSLEVRTGSGGMFDLGPLVTVLLVALIAGVVAGWLVPFVIVRPGTASRRLAGAALLLLTLAAWPGVVTDSFLWGLFVVGGSWPPGNVLTALLVLAGGATAALGIREARPLVRAAVSRHPPSSVSVMPWTAGAVVLVPALAMVGLSAAVATVLFIPPLAAVTLPRGTGLAVWSAGLGSLVGCAAGLGSLAGLPAGPLAVLVVAVAGGWPPRLRPCPEGEGA